MNDEPVIAEDQPVSGERSPLAFFVGFLLLGAAAALLLFGGGLFTSRGKQEDRSPAVLDQVAAFPTASSSDIAAIPSGDQAQGALEVGDRAHDFSLSDPEGNLVTLSEFLGQPVVVNFWATWCAPCRIEMPELQDAHERYREQGLVILALDQDETAEAARQFFDEMDLTFTPLLDDNSITAAAYGGFGILPTTYFLDRDGMVSAIHRGPLSRRQIEGYLEAILENRG